MKYMMNINTVQIAGSSYKEKVSLLDMNATPIHYLPTFTKELGV